MAIKNIKAINLKKSCMDNGSAGGAMGKNLIQACW
jgi:hypothetical protein